MVSSSSRRYPLTAILVAVIAVAALATAVSARGEKKDSMAGMDMSCMADMNGVSMDEMGPSMRWP